MKEVQVTIDANGKVTVGVTGAVGNSCLTLTRDLERALGASGSEHRELKPEFHQRGQEGGQNAAQR